MEELKDISKEIEKAKKDIDVADALIEKYMPFIKKQVYEYVNVKVLDSMDELSVAMIAFHEAIRSFNSAKGNFFAYAKLIIRSRLIDYTRKEVKHVTISLDENVKDEDNITLLDTIPSEENVNDEVITKLSLTKELNDFRIDLCDYQLDVSDIVDNCPRQERSYKECAEVLDYTLKHREILDKMVKKKRLPIIDLARGCNVSIKVLNRYKKYIIAILLIQTNGYLMMREHINALLKGAINK